MNTNGSGYRALTLQGLKGERGKKVLKSTATFGVGLPSRVLIYFAGKYEGYFDVRECWKVLHNLAFA